MNRGPDTVTIHLGGSEWLSARDVRNRYNVSDMTLYRWLRTLGAPQPTYRGSRRYWRREEWDEWDATCKQRGRLDQAQQIREGSVVHSTSTIVRELLEIIGPSDDPRVERAAELLRRYGEQNLK